MKIWLQVVIALVPLSVCFAVPRTEGGADLTAKPESEWHAFVGKQVQISGTYSRYGKFGPAVSTGKGNLYIIEGQEKFPPIDDRSEILASGILRFQQAEPRKGQSKGFFYIKRRDCVINVSVS